MFAFVATQSGVLMSLIDLCHLNVNMIIGSQYHINVGQCTSKNVNIKNSLNFLKIT
jgi:hypothetical protein